MQGHFNHELRKNVRRTSPQARREIGERRRRSIRPSSSERRDYGQASGELDEKLRDADDRSVADAVAGRAAGRPRMRSSAEEPFPRIPGLRPAQAVSPAAL